MADNKINDCLMVGSLRITEKLQLRCPLCGDPLEKKGFKSVVKMGKVYDMYFCTRCGMGITIPFPSQDDLSLLYSSSYRSVSGKRFNILIEKIIYLFRIGRKRRIEKYVQSGRILDIGCGRGIFLSLMKENGWEVIGTEFNKESAAHAENTYNLKVLTGHPDKWGVPEESFDVITLNHVLEHIDDPLGTITACWKLLKQGGLLVIAVPDISSLQGAIGKELWFHADIPYHLYHFSEKGLVELLMRNSLRILKVRRFDLEYCPYGWLQTLLNLSGIRVNFLYDLLKRPEIRKEILLDSRGKDVLITSLLLPFYLPLSIALSIFESFIMRRGGTIEVYALKE